jgi:hypothetical protein
MAPFGTMAMTEPSALNALEAISPLGPPKRTVNGLIRENPRIVTAVPGAPLVGLTLVITGGGVGAALMTIVTSGE